ncbi:tRNA 2'-phosphotransferase [Carabus blaptoides fortunei]
MSVKNNINDIHISKTLSWLLRHGAVKESLPINPDGFINVQTILQHRSLRGKCSVEDIKRIVVNNDKQRFALRSSDNVLEIRANQGHSVKEINAVDLKPIYNASELNSIIHGTFYTFWNSIKTNGLSRMNRNHIHFASGLPSDSQVISGMRKSCELYIYINVASVLSAGISIFRSANGVILSSGNEKGVIETKHFLKVIDAASGNILTY